MLENLSGLVVFAKVVEEGGFSRAAAALGISKSSVSKQLAALEDRLGTRLLNRTTRRLGLTEPGALLYERCQRILAELDEAEREAGSLQTRPAGTLRISAGVSFGHILLARELPGFLADYPELAVDLVVNDRRVDLVEEGYDLALRIGTLADSSLVARRLSPIRQIAVASEGYLTRHGEPGRPEDLAAHACIGYSYLNDGEGWDFRDGERTLRQRFQPQLKANNGETILTLAEAGLGIAQLPTFIAGEAIGAGRLKPILCPFEPRPYPLHAVYPHARNLPLKVRAFIDYLSRRFTARPYWDEGLPPLAD